MPFFAIENLLAVLGNLAGILLTWGWLFIVFFVLWIAWEIYQWIKRLDYITSIQFTYLQIKVPEDAPQTPKAMEQAFEVWGGIHKNPDLIEKYFEGYTLAWYSCEMQCTRNRVRFIMVVPTLHRKFFEGVIYGQYPTAEITEVEDYVQEFSIREIDNTIDLFGTEMALQKEDYYPIRTYNEYEDKLAEDERFIDPLQSLIEAFTTIEEGEHFWVQILVRPVDAKKIDQWSAKGQDKILALAGRTKEKPAGIVRSIVDFAAAVPAELVQAFTTGPLEGAAKEERKERFFMNPAEQEESKGILQKVSRNAFRAKIRLIHIAPIGKLHKPNIGKAIGVFKQFAFLHLNSLYPTSETKTNGPNYIMKKTRRNYRKRRVFTDYLYRDFWGDDSGQMFTGEELATLYHFPTKYGRSPALQRATSGLGSAPENLPLA